ncbi:MAG TPA: hypothetical protein VHG91_07420 [Longimicrobium sp.]|nr:hypothetical protein [Longimicrobium sp.]
MATSHCRACGETLPAGSAACPRCAAEAPGRGDRVVGTLVLLLAASLLALGFVAGVVRPRLSRPSSPPPAASPSPSPAPADAR